MKTINEFQGEYRFLSNFWPCYLMYQNLLYPTAEHAYQAAKVESPDVKTSIKNCATPAEAKDFFETYKIKPDPGWTIAKKLLVMEEILMIKFGGKDPFLTRALLATGDANLVEGNSWNDTFWGVCNNSGENNLGRLLMKVREELVRQKQQIIFQLAETSPNDTVAEALSITPRELYEKMIAFRIQNKEYWIS
ncbi:MAG TPA: NADAR family protein [Chitinophagaceae bacterium]